MAEYRTSGTISIGSQPPQSIWTVVSGDTASFKMYVQDDAGNPLTIGDWTIEMDFYREGATSNPILSVTPAADEDDGPGEFTVFVSSTESALLQSDDVFDIKMSLPLNVIVWTVLQGTMNVLEDITG